MCVCAAIYRGIIWNPMQCGMPSLQKWSDLGGAQESNGSHGGRRRSLRRRSAVGAWKPALRSHTWLCEVMLSSTTKEFKAKFQEV